MATVKKQARRDYGSGSVYQRKDGMWIATFEAGITAAGTRRRVTVSAKTRPEVLRRRKAKQDELATGAASTMNVRTTVQAFSQTWLERTVKHLRPKSYATNASCIKKWIVPTIGHRRLGDLTAADVLALMDAQADAGMAASSIVRTQAVLVKMLRAAMVDGARIHPGVFAVDRPSLGETDRQAMPLQDALAMLKLIESEPDPSRWVGALLNGIRQGERLGMREDDLDFENDTIEVRWQLQQLNYIDVKNKALGFRVPANSKAIQLKDRFHLVPPKTKKSIRKLPMTPWFRAAALARIESGVKSPHGLLWGDEAGEPVDAKDDRLDWYDLQRRAGVAKPDGQPYGVHEIRHTTITLLKELRVPDDVIERIVGQSKLVQAYNHAEYMPEVRKALDSLAERLQLHVAEATVPALEQ